MRIVAGKHRGRRLEAPVGRDVRPTTDRTRQSLFNILTHGDWADERDSVEGAVVLDGFCGTGALGLEALSRGAATVLFLDKARASLDLARANAATLGETEACRFILGDAVRPPSAPMAADLVFLDPPYGQNLAPAALLALAEAGWVAPGALVVVEVGERDPFPLLHGFPGLDERRYPQARIIFLRYCPG